MTLVDARDDLEDVRDTGDDTVVVDTHVVVNVVAVIVLVGGRRAAGRWAGRQAGRQADRQADHNGEKLVKTVRFLIKQSDFQLTQKLVKWQCLHLVMQ